MRKQRGACELRGWVRSFKGVLDNVTSAIMLTRAERQATMECLCGRDPNFFLKWGSIQFRRNLQVVFHSFVRFQFSFVRIRIRYRSTHGDAIASVRSLTVAVSSVSFFRVSVMTSAYISRRRIASGARGPGCGCLWQGGFWHKTPYGEHAWIPTTWNQCSSLLL